jgi:signal transduction histidine kinase
MDDNQKPAALTFDTAGAFTAIAEYAPLPMATVDSVTRIISHVNPAFCSLMRQTKAQLVGRLIADILPDDDECQSMLDRVCATGRPQSHTERQLSSPHHAMLSFTMWPVLAGSSVAAVTLQVTETAALNDEKLALNEALMISSVRQHEMIEAAENYISRLKLELIAYRETTRVLAEKARTIDLTDEQRRHFQEERAANLVHLRIASMTREKTERSGPARAPSRQFDRGERDREVEFIIPEVVANDADPRMLRMVLNNLLGNETVRQVVNRHGGEVWAEGELGEGATFYFKLESTYQE